MSGLSDTRGQSPKTIEVSIMDLQRLILAARSTLVRYRRDGLIGDESILADTIVRVDKLVAALTTYWSIPPDDDNVKAAITEFLAQAMWRGCEYACGCVQHADGRFEQCVKAREIGLAIEAARGMETRYLHEEYWQHFTEGDVAQE